MSVKNQHKFTNAVVSEFIKQNPHFDILASDLSRRERLSELDFNGHNRKKVIDELSHYQRLLRINPDAEIAERLRANGFTSAHQIASIPVHRFLREYASTFEGGEAQAREIHQNAVAIKAGLKHVWANVRDTVASHHYRATLAQTLDPDFIESFTSMPGYQDLFGGLNYCSCQHCGSMLSPSAYFLDLMRITYEYITDPNINKHADNIAQGYRLEERRPDLFFMKLNCKNTTTVIPQLEIVNDILQRRIESEVRRQGAGQILFDKDENNVKGVGARFSSEVSVGDRILCEGQVRTVTFVISDQRLAVDSSWAALETPQDYFIASAFKSLAVAGYPFNLPFNLPLAEIELYLEELKSSLPSIFLDFLAPEAGPSGVQPIDIARAYIGLSVEEYDIITTPDATRPGLSRYYGYEDILKHLSFGGSGHITFEKGGRSVGGAGTAFTTELFVGDLIECAGEARTVIEIKSDSELVVDLAWDVEPGDGNYTVLPADCLERVEVFLYRTGLSREQLGKLFDQDLDKQELDEGLANTFFINRTDENLPYLHVADNKSDPNFPFMQIVGMSLKRLDRLNRFIRLASKLGWTYADLDWVLASVGEREITETAIQAIAAVKKLQVLTRMPVVALCGFWHDIKTTGKVSASALQDLFDSVFNNPALLGGLSPYDQNNPPVPFNPSEPLDWNTDGEQAMTAQDTTIRARLMAALLVNDNDLTKVAKYLTALLGDNGAILKLTVTNLTWLYRLTVMASTSRFTIDEYLLLLGLTYYPDDPYLEPPADRLPSNVAGTARIFETGQWLRNSTFNAYELQYILTGTRSKYVNPGYAEEDVVSFVKNLSTGSESSTLTAPSFIFEGIDEDNAQTIFNQIKAHEFFNKFGIMTPKSHVTYDQIFLLRVTTELSFVAVGKGYEDVFQELLAYKIIDGAGYIVNFQASTSLDFLFKDDPQAPEKRNAVKAILRALLTLTMLVRKETFVTSNIQPEESPVVFDELKSEGIIIVKPDGQGDLSQTFNEHTDLSFLFKGDTKADLKRAEVEAILLEIKREIEHTTSIIQAVCVQQEQTALEGVATFLGAKPDMIDLLLPFAAGQLNIPDYIAYLISPLSVKESDRPETHRRMVAVAHLLKLVSRWLMLAKRLDITAYEVDAIITEPQAFNIEDIEKLTIANVQSLWTFKGLQRAFGDEQELLTSYLLMWNPDDQKCPDDKVYTLAEVTGWDAHQICALINLFWQPSSPVADAYGTVAGVARLNRCFELGARMGVDIYFLLKVLSLSHLPLTGPDGAFLESNWATYVELAGAILGAVNAKYKDAEFDELFKEVTGNLNTAKRDALSGYCIWTLSKAHSSILYPSDLYQYLLIDVEMGDCASTSYIAEGIASVQLYMQRCRMSLEPGVTVLEIPDVWWEWMSAYRVWEVNRKIFLYPENYVEPGLRKDMTPLFKQTLDSLLQTDITDATVSQAFYDYMDQFDDVSNLVICSTYNCMREDPETGKPVETMFLIGRTSTEPYTYYYRTFRNSTVSDGYFDSAWESIDLKIKSPYVTAVYAFGRLFLYWVELQTIKASSPKPKDQSQTQPTSVVKATIYYSYYNFSKVWEQPQIFMSDVLINIAPDDYFDKQDQEVKALFEATDLFWRQPYVLKINRGIPGVGAIDIIKGTKTVKISERTVSGYIKGGIYTKIADQITEGDKIWCAGELREIKGKEFNPDRLALDTAWNTSLTTAPYKIIRRDKEFNQFSPYVGSGTVIIKEQSNKVLGSITFFKNEVSIGSLITVGITLETRMVVKIIGDTELEVDQPWTKTPQESPLVYYKITPTTNGSEKLVVLFGSALDTSLPFNMGPFDGVSSNPGKDTFIEELNTFNTALGDLLYTAKKVWIKGHLTTLSTELPYANVFAQSYRNLILDYDRYDTNNPRPYKPVLERESNILMVAQSNNSIVDNYWANNAPGTTSPGINDPRLQLLNHVSEASSSIFNVGNQPGHFIFNNGDEAFLARSGELNLQKLSDITFASTNVDTGGYTLTCGPYSTTPQNFNDLKFSFYRLSTNTIKELSLNLFVGGIDKLLSIKSQETPELPFNRFYVTPADKPAHVIPPPNDKLDFRGAYGDYFREIFFYTPFLIAERLNENKRFDEARKWYHYIFNPAAKVGNANSKNEYWQFLPFRQGIDIESLTEILMNEKQIETYNDDPFDPHAIAQLRPSAYEKAIVMRYIDNLLDWGDFLFAQDTRESITQATNLYVMAADLLGKRPEAVAQCPVSESKSFEDIRREYPAGIPEFLIQLENTPFALIVAGQVTFSDVPFNDIDSYFCVPENRDLIAYWDRVEDRLFKIRHCMNISGVERQTPLFEPPLNPADYARGAASGGGLPAGARAAPPIPNYRFPYMLDAARAMTANVIQLGAALLSALERQDAEQLSLMLSVQQQALLNQMTMMKQDQIEQTMQTQASLVESRNSAKSRADHYRKLLDKGLSSGESKNLDAMKTAFIFNLLAGISRTAASFSYAVPNVGAPTAMTYGGQQIGAVWEMRAGVFELGAQVSTYIADRSLTMAGYERRDQDWELQETLANYDVQQIGYQMSANEIQLKIARRDLEVHNETIRQNEEIETYLKSKFTNKEIYQWMAGLLSQLYFQTYTLAHEMANSAQRAFQYELNTNKSFVNFGYWDNLHKGLLAGEGLMLALNQMNKAYIDENARALEIEKTVSLARLKPEALLDLKTKGECAFELSEKLFDEDFPGHYCRKIKSISVSIPAVVGPYQNISAALVQVGNHIILRPDIDAVSFLMGGDTATLPGTDVLRSNWRINQQMAITKGSETVSAGDGDDVRYLSFEGTGAVSNWRLSMPFATNHINFNAISDVILRLDYTALDGGANFRSQVISLPALQTYYGSSLLVFNQEYSQQWFTFLHDHSNPESQTMLFELPPGLVPPHVADAKLIGFSFILVVPEGTDTTADRAYVTFQITNSESIDFKLNDKNSFTYAIQKKTDMASVFGKRRIIFDLRNGYIPTDLKKDGFLNPDVINGMLLLLHYEGGILWSPK